MWRADVGSAMLAQHMYATAGKKFDSVPELQKLMPFEEKEDELSVDSVFKKLGGVK